MKYENMKVTLETDELIGLNMSALTLLAIQKKIARWIVPDSGISDHDLILSIVKLADNEALVESMKAISVLEGEE